MPTDRRRGFAGLVGAPMEAQWGLMDREVGSWKAVPTGMFPLARVSSGLGYEEGAWG